MESKRTNDEFWQEEIVKFLKCELTISEEQKLNDWVRSDINHLNIFQEIREAWLASVTLQTNMENVDEKWNQLIKKSEESIFNKPKTIQLKPKTIQLKPNYKRIAGLAAILLVTFLSGVLVSKFLNLNVNKSGSEVTEVITPLGAKSQIMLPDGTQVWLNAGSKLSYRKSFNEKERLVSLQGEAFFKVKTNRNKSFIVQTSKMNVKALGTSFNVKAYLEDKAITATLVEGVIEVEGKGADSKTFSIRLKPKESLTLKDAESSEEQKNKKLMRSSNGLENNKEETANKLDDVLVEKQINTEKYTSWKDPFWQIEAENLQTLSLLLSRRFNVVIHNESMDLQDYRFTGTIRNETLEQVMEILTYTTPLKYKIGKGEVWWEIDPVQKEKYSKILDKQ